MQFESFLKVTMHTLLYTQPHTHTHFTLGKIINKYLCGLVAGSLATYILPHKTSLQINKCEQVLNSH